jgi:ferredoxin
VLVQCPDAAIPGLVSEVDEVLRAAMSRPEGAVRFDRLQPLLRPFAAEIRKVLKADAFKDFPTTLDAAWASFAPKARPTRRGALSTSSSRPSAASSPRSRSRGPSPSSSGPKPASAQAALFAVINPAACKWCNICVAVCPEHALVAVKQTDDVVADLRKNWKVWERLPDTRERYVNVPDRNEGIGVLSTCCARRPIAPWWGRRRRAWGAARRRASTWSSRRSAPSSSRAWRSTSSACAT